MYNMTYTSNLIQKKILPKKIGCIFRLLRGVKFSVKQLIKNFGNQKFPCGVSKSHILYGNIALLFKNKK